MTQQQRPPAKKLASIDEAKEMSHPSRVKKIRRTSMVHPIVSMVVMPVSQACAWWLVLQQGRSLFESASQVSAFNCVWAFCNRYIAGRVEEQGHWIMGTFALISMTERRNYAILAALIVLLNLAVSLGSCIYFGPRNLAKVLHKSTGDVAIVWAFVFTVYMVSQVAMWSSITTRLWLMPSDGWKLIFHSVEQEL